MCVHTKYPQKKTSELQNPNWIWWSYYFPLRNLKFILICFELDLSLVIVCMEQLNSVIFIPTYIMSSTTCKWRKAWKTIFFFNQTFPQQVHLITYVYLQSSCSWGRKEGGECHILSPFSKNTSSTWSCIVFWLQQWISLKYIVIIFALVSFLFPDCTRLIPSLPLRRNILSH